MKPHLDHFAVVTATLDESRAADCLASWTDRAHWSWNLITIKGEFGVVPAFAQGVEVALRTGAQVIACLHDDLLIEQDGWDSEVLEAFSMLPEMGLCGFGGGTGLGDSDIYQKAYTPYQLARQGFVSNMREAEAHGRRSIYVQRVACLDGFSLIGRADFWRGRKFDWVLDAQAGKDVYADVNLFAEMFDWGVTHHAYDSALGAWAKRLDWQVWMLPIACHHLGGRTAVGDPRYEEWARTIVPGGDRDFWELSHQIVYERFRDVLPIRV